MHSATRRVIEPLAVPGLRARRKRVQWLHHRAAYPIGGPREAKMELPAETVDAAAPLEIAIRERPFA